MWSSNSTQDLNIFWYKSYKQLGKIENGSPIPIFSLPCLISFCLPPFTPKSSTSIHCKFPDFKLCWQICKSVAKREPGDKPSMTRRNQSSRTATVCAHPACSPNCMAELSASSYSVHSEPSCWSDCPMVYTDHLFLLASIVQFSSCHFPPLLPNHLSSLWSCL